MVAHEVSQFQVKLGTCEVGGNKEHGKNLFDDVERLNIIGKEDVSIL
jgi:hypothetical protein